MFGKSAKAFGVCALLGAVVAAPAVVAAASTCYGRVGQGRIEGAVALPRSGDNFDAYSGLGVTLGRTYVHDEVRAIVTDAYARTQKAMPDRTFVYGETGWEKGGRFRPHRTHQNGTSVDFMVPVRDAKGRSVQLPGNAVNKFGYDLEFNGRGSYEELTIDFTAIAEHLYQLSQAAKARKSDLALVIFEHAWLPKLYATPRGAYLKKQVRFMQGKPWIRHDEHYHVDFAIPCEPLDAKFS